MEVATARFSVSYSQLAANKRENLADAEPLLPGDDSVSAFEDDDVLLKEDTIDGQSEETESCRFEDNYRATRNDKENARKFRQF